MKETIVPIIGDFHSQTSHIWDNQLKDMVAEKVIRQEISQCYPPHRYPPREVVAIFWNWVNYRCIDPCTYYNVTIEEVIQRLVTWEDDPFVLVKLIKLLREFEKVRNVEK